MTRLAAIAALCCYPLPAEKLTYTAEWRLFDAGLATIESAGSAVSLSLATHGVVGKLHHVDDRYRASYSGGQCVASSWMRSEEGSEIKETNVTYADGLARLVERDLKKNTSESKQVEIPACVHDVVGLLMRVRGMRLEPGEEVTLPVSDGRKSAMARIEAQQVETVRTPAGRFRAIRHEAFLHNGVLFRRKARLFVWLTADERRVPVQIKVELPFYVGDVTLKLQKASVSTTEEAFLRR